MKAWATKQLQGGFTITEVLTVLAVTGILFVSISASITSRQAAAEFTQATQTIRTDMISIINEIQVGYYSDPNEGFAGTAQEGLTRTGCNNKDDRPFLVLQTSVRGAHENCIVLGRALEFRVFDPADPYKVFDADDPSKDINNYDTDTIFGFRTNDDGENVTNLSEAKPQIPKKYGSCSSLDPKDTADRTVCSNTSRSPLLNGLEVTDVWYGALSDRTNISKQIPVFAFMTKINASGASPVSSQQLDVYPITAAYYTFMTNHQSPIVPPPDPNPDGGIHVCFSSGTTKQSALLTIGGNNDPTAVNMSIKPANTSSVHCGI